MSRDSKDDVYDASLFPVFVTAEVPIETINKCLTKSHDFTCGEEVDHLQAVYLITTANVPRPTMPQSLPVAPFKSPFLGKSVDEMVEIFKKTFRPADDDEHALLAASVFVILDERTIKDDNALIVHVRANDQVTTARCDYDIVSMMSLPPEMGVADLGEALDGYGSGDQVLTLEQYLKGVMPVEIDELDEDDSDEEKEN